MESVPKPELRAVLEEKVLLDVKNVLATISLRAGLTAIIFSGKCYIGSMSTTKHKGFVRCRAERVGKVDGRQVLCVVREDIWLGYY